MVGVGFFRFYLLSSVACVIPEHKVVGKKPGFESYKVFYFVCRLCVFFLCFLFRCRKRESDNFAKLDERRRAVGMSSPTRDRKQAKDQRGEGANW